MPFSQKQFYHVVRSVNDYYRFVPYMTRSDIDKETHQFNKATKKGSFLATTSIGFDMITFDYTSKVSYKQPCQVVSESNQEISRNRMFNELYSQWDILQLSPYSCKVNYTITMSMSNPVYMAVTKRVFDLLAQTMHSSFQERCYDLFHHQNETEMSNIDG
jgi:ribosome-associated toxin RatA of RatAB toxin-antitoxin module